MASDPSAMAPVMAAAAQHQLGNLIDSTQLAKGLIRKSNDYVHRFEHGLVGDHKKGPVALPYRDMQVYRHQTNHLSKNYPYRVTANIIDWRFERGDGQAWKTTVEHKGADTNSELNQVFEQALGAACALQRDAAVARLRAGEQLTFGPVQIDRAQLTGGGLRETVAWSAVQDVSVDQGTLKATSAREGRFIKQNLHNLGKVADIPNFPLLWQLIEIARSDDQRTSPG